ncbi:MAG TPA: hypothetical protein VF865_17120, partial [Acidobacteriaceae bacterium]
ELFHIAPPDAPRPALIGGRLTAIVKRSSGEVAKIVTLLPLCHRAAETNYSKSEKTVSVSSKAAAQAA